MASHHRCLAALNFGIVADSVNGDEPPMPLGDVGVAAFSCDFLRVGSGFTNPKTSRSSTYNAYPAHSTSAAMSRHLHRWLLLFGVFLLILGTPLSVLAAGAEASDSTAVDSSATLAPADPSPIHRTADRFHRAIDPWDSRAHRQVGAFAGDVSSAWPFRRERALYPSTPAVRYNRVEGFVLGVQRHPMHWGDSDDHRIYGQVGYAFALKRLRYAAGFELRIDSQQDDRYGLKVGALYRRNTATNDAWKTSWLENSLAASLFNIDSFDYHEVQGWTLYATHRFTRYAQLTTGFRTEDYSSLQQETTWSLFGGRGFTTNPAIDAGYYNTFVLALEGGRVDDFDDTPRGGAFRLEAELGQGFGNPIAFNRYQADGRAYVPVTPFSTLGLRLRGGYATDGAPLQKRFSIGGIGSVRSYPQNGFEGTRTLVGNAEYIVDDVELFDSVFDDLTLIGFIDAGWVGRANTRFSVDDVLPAAGFGIGFGERAIRVDVSWPLRNVTGDTTPSVWLRISPSF